MIDGVTLINSALEAILSDGNSHGTVVNRCSVTGCGRGIDLAGDDLVVTGTKLTNTNGDGLQLSGDRTRVTRCTLSVIEDGDGILISFNRIQGTASAGIIGDGDLLRIMNNQVSYPGEENDGIEIEGSTNTLTRNQALDGGNSGILIKGLTSVGNVLELNQVTGNHGQGLRNDGVNTAIQKNTFQRNRLDVGNNVGAGATLIDNGGNRITTGADLETEPET